MSSALLGVRNALDAFDDLLGSYAEDVGDERLERRLQEVSNDWRRNRQELAEGVRALGDWAGQAADAYEDADRALGQAIDSTGRGVSQAEVAGPVVDERPSGVPLRSGP